MLSGHVERVFEYLLTPASGKPVGIRTTSATSPSEAIRMMRESGFSAAELRPLLRRLQAATTVAKAA